MRSATPTREPDEIHWGLIRAVSASVADTVVFPMQDILGLDSRARMNFPGKAEGNWLWRYRKEQVDQEVRDRLAEITAVVRTLEREDPREMGPAHRPSGT